MFGGEPIPKYRQPKTLVLCTTGFDAGMTDLLAKGVKNATGTYKPELDATVKVLLWNHPHITTSAKLELAKTLRIRAVVADWLWCSLREGYQMPLAEFDPTWTTRQSTVLTGVSISIIGRDPVRNDRFRALVLQFGGTIAPVGAAKYVIVLKQSRGTIPEMEEARAKGLVLLSSRWLFDSVSAGRLLDPSDFGWERGLTQGSQAPPKLSPTTKAVKRKVNPYSVNEFDQVDQHSARIPANEPRILTSPKNPGTRPLRAPISVASPINSLKAPSVPPPTVAPGSELQPLVPMLPLPVLQPSKPADPAANPAIPTMPGAPLSADIFDLQPDLPDQPGPPAHLTESRPSSHQPSGDSPHDALDALLTGLESAPKKLRPAPSSGDKARPRAVNIDFGLLDKPDSPRPAPAAPLEETRASQLVIYGNDDDGLAAADNVLLGKRSRGYSQY
jgi:hypothetical protein